jgi:hypothetical protein
MLMVGPDRLNIAIGSDLIYRQIDVISSMLSTLSYFRHVVAPQDAWCLSVCTTWLLQGTTQGRPRTVPTLLTLPSLWLKLSNKGLRGP